MNCGCFRNQTCLDGLKIKLKRKQYRIWDL